MGNPSKQKGTRFETAVTDYLRWALQDERIQRLTLHGSKDIGDIGNVYFHGAPVVLECKATRAPHYAKHWGECETEMGNHDSEYGWVIWKRPGIGLSRNDTIGQHLAYTRKQVYVQMTDMLGPQGSTFDALTVKIPRNPLLIGLNLEHLALLLNNGVEIGPDQPEF